MIYDKQLNELWKTPTLQTNHLIRYAPAPNLSSTIEQYFLVDNQQTLHIPTYILPDLSAHILLHEIQTVKGVYYRFSIVGSRSEGFLLNRQSRKRTFIIRLAPGILPKLLPLSGKETNNQSLLLGEFFPAIAEQLTVLFSNKNGTGAPPTYIFKWLETHLFLPIQAQVLLPNAVKEFLHCLDGNYSNWTVQKMAKKLGYSERYLYKMSIQYLGMNPNKAIRVQRLLSSFKNRVKYPNYNWSDIAFQSGYADQSHLIAEYQEMMECTPRQLFL